MSCALVGKKWSRVLLANEIVPLGSLAALAIEVVVGFYLEPFRHIQRRRAKSELLVMHM